LPTIKRPFDLKYKEIEMAEEINNGQNYIDTRDIIERIEELEDMRDNYEDDWDESPESEELNNLLDLQEECSGSTDWKYGETLIRRSEWVDYCEELCKDCGYISSDLPSWIEIDWDATAENIEADYTSVYFDDVEYLIRS
jgi:hypothetical protein